MTEENAVDSLDFRYDDLPDEILPVSSGVHRMRIVGTPSVEERSSERTGKSWKQLSLSFVITTEGEDEDKVIYDNPRVDDKRGQVKIKRLAKSAGIEVSNDNPLTLADLENKDVIGVVKTRTYKDSDGETQTANSIKDYLTEVPDGAAGNEEEDEEVE